MLEWDARLRDSPVHKAAVLSVSKMRCSNLIVTGCFLFDGLRDLRVLSTRCRASVQILLTAVRIDRRPGTHMGSPFFGRFFPLVTPVVLRQVFPFLSAE